MSFKRSEPGHEFQPEVMLQFPSLEKLKSTASMMGGPKVQAIDSDEYVINSEIAKRGKISSLLDRFRTTMISMQSIKSGSWDSTKAIRPAGRERQEIISEKFVDIPLHEEMQIVPFDSSASFLTTELQVQPDCISVVSGLTDDTSLSVQPYDARSWDDYSSLDQKDRDGLCYIAESLGCNEESVEIKIDGLFADLMGLLEMQMKSAPRCDQLGLSCDPSSSDMDSSRLTLVTKKPAPSFRQEIAGQAIAMGGLQRKPTFQLMTANTATIVNETRSALETGFEVEAMKSKCRITPVSIPVPEKPSFLDFAEEGFEISLCPSTFRQSLASTGVQSSTATQKNAEERLIVKRKDNSTIRIYSVAHRGQTIPEIENSHRDSGMTTNGLGHCLTSEELEADDALAECGSVKKGPFVCRKKPLKIFKLTLEAGWTGKEKGSRHKQLRLFWTKQLPFKTRRQRNSAPKSKRAEFSLVKLQSGISECQNVSIYTHTTESSTKDPSDDIFSVASTPLRYHDVETIFNATGTSSPVR